MEKEHTHSEMISEEEKFSQTYEGASIVPVSYEELPQVVVDYFESNSALYVSPKEYLARNFSHLYLLTHPDGSLTYIAEQTKNYEKESIIEEIAYLIDYVDGAPAGHGEIRHNISDENTYFKGKPFVGYTRTYAPDDKRGGGKDFQRQQLGIRRIIEMDAYSYARFGAHLNSSSNPSPGAEGVWKRLIEGGKAEAYVESKGARGNDIIRYRMK